MKKQKKVSSWKHGALSALFAGLFIVFACSEGSKTSTNESSSQKDEAEAKKEGEVFTVVEDLPQYPEGIEAFFTYLESEIKYPKEALEKGVEGQVLVQFVIDRNGSIAEVRAVEGIGAGCEDEVIRVLESAPSFRPGTQRGRTVRVQRAMSITFQLKNEENNTQGIVIAGEMTKVDFIFKIDAKYTDGEWSGTIYDEETGDVLPGANIVVAGTTLGTVSDLDGSFSLKVKEAKEVVVSFVGYQSLKLAGK